MHLCVHFSSLAQHPVRRFSKVQYHEHLLLFRQMAGNPDQQEDNVDEQYQEEGEEEVYDGMYGTGHTGNTTFRQASALLTLTFRLKGNEKGVGA